MVRKPADADRDHEQEMNRLETLFDLADEARGDGTWCIVGHHMVPIGTARMTPQGTMVCRDCAKTAAGQKALTPFDPTR